MKSAASLTTKRGDIYLKYYLEHLNFPPKPPGPAATSFSYSAKQKTLDTLTISCDLATTAAKQAKGIFACSSSIKMCGKEEEKSTFCLPEEILQKLSKLFGKGTLQKGGIAKRDRIMKGWQVHISFLELPANQKQSKYTTSSRNVSLDCEYVQVMNSAGITSRFPDQFTWFFFIFIFLNENLPPRYNTCNLYLAAGWLHVPASLARAQQDENYINWMLARDIFTLE